MRLETRQDYVGSSLRVSGVYQDGVREFARRRSRLAERLSRVAEKLTGSYDSLVMDVWRFVEGIGKLAGTIPRDRRKKTVRLTTKMTEVAGLTRVRS
ncbi:hypothetical protein GW17_00002981 [Ensete ventricosum]|nr:hypothetical protein GW17_00002981 [Ensete ventricosum]RZS28013.1 hypothetical protein BHM03_00061562 [Ensete ventricosum]